MKLYLGLLASSPPDQTRIFAEIDGKLIDVNLAYAAHLTKAQGKTANAYELAAFYFPQTIAEYLARGEAAKKSFDEVVAFVRRTAVIDLRGLAGEKIAYDAKDIRCLPPFLNPEKSIVIGFSDRARTEAIPKPETPTAFTSCRKLSLLAVHRSSGRNSRKKSTPTAALPLSSARPAKGSRQRKHGTMSRARR